MPHTHAVGACRVGCVVADLVLWYDDAPGRRSTVVEYIHDLIIDISMLAECGEPQLFELVEACLTRLLVLLLFLSGRAALGLRLTYTDTVPYVPGS